MWGKTTVTTTAFENAHTYSPHPTIPNDVSALHCTRNLRLVDPNDDFPDPPIEVSVGGEHYWRLIKDNHPLCISPSLVRLPFIFGMILSGNRLDVSVNHIAINNIELCQNFHPRDSQLRRFWSLEAMGITDTDTASHSIKNTAMLSSFSDSFGIEDGSCVTREERTRHTS
jgi:hypothetical protein